MNCAHADKEKKEKVVLPVDDQWAAEAGGAVIGCLVGGLAGFLIGSVCFPAGDHDYALLGQLASGVAGGFVGGFAGMPVAVAVVKRAFAKKRKAEEEARECRESFMRSLYLGDRYKNN